ncbi:hypothetical protein AMS68_004452 [Peltaster fructicola]|uniref:Maintenance of telomere capping protein 1 n=1 Tax=Peltaster fructicola TaxID=286661 RepID=A0A6H0XWA2_9PEZI|nr:hypothetical protein AMS68_004452 [Peltaster fructicola]
MARKGEDLLAELEGLGGGDDQPSTANTAAANNNIDDDPLADLQAQLSAKPAQTTSRPNTPRLSSSTTSAGTSKRAEHTPASSGQNSGRNSSDERNRGNVRKSNEQSRNFHQGITPGDEIEDEMSFAASTNTTGTGVGWWGSIISSASATATAAIKQAETLTKDLRNNEEAARWAEQVRVLGGKNLSNLQSLSSDLRSRALPTFTTLLQHIAPPISAHERLQIHITHDILGYPSLDPLIYRTFERTMAQVEGGELLVIQRGSESKGKAQSSGGEGYRGGLLSNSSGWTDGPWWRDVSVKRSLGTVPGLKEGTRLARAINYTQDKDLFADDARAEKSTAVADPDDETEESVAFAIYLHDPIHGITFSTLSQSFPARWSEWLDASSDADDESALPESIRGIIEAGGVDPREWVAEWLEEVLMLAVGVLAQRYVAKRMGVGEGGLGRGKKRVEESSLGGEAARAL